MLLLKVEGVCNLKYIFTIRGGDKMGLKILHPMDVKWDIF